jgi:putative heme iron utilization protein
MSQSDQQAAAARQLWAGVFHGVLSTQSLEHAGYPFGSVVPYVLDQTGQPLMLLSHLSQHTKNVDANAHCGFTVLQPGAGNVQERSRLSAVGDVHALGASEDAERYFACFPQARTYHEQLGFRFYRLQALRFHWNGGFATARWFSAERIARPNPLPRDVQARIIAHMNDDHRDALRHYLGDAATPPADAAVVMVGIDAEGIDLRVADRLYRIQLAREIATGEEAREVLVQMASTTG